MRPHPRGSFEVLFTREAFADHVSWLMFNRPFGLGILVHPLTRLQLLDHTRRALWIGPPLAIDCAILEEADARLLGAPDEARNRSSWIRQLNVPERAVIGRAGDVALPRGHEPEGSSPSEALGEPALGLANAAHRSPLGRVQLPDPESQRLAKAATVQRPAWPLYSCRVAASHSSRAEQAILS
ncbi:MAG: hypothetical protein IAE86_02960 [Burkholderiaceae bacterium]|nr:hypothetical protein [Burkholderiaceae bacterium]